MARLKVLEFVRSHDAVWNLPAEALAPLKHEFPEVEFESPASQADADRLLPESEVVLGWAVRPHNLASASRLRWVHLTAAGVGGQLFPEFVASEIVLTNSRGLHAVSIAEHVIGVMFTFARKLHLSRDAQRERRWTQREAWVDPPPILELAGGSLGLIGLGTIGGAIATRARALGMTVRAVTRRPRKDPAPAHEVWGAEQIERLAAISDWLVLAAPETAATRGMIGAAVLDRMPAHAILINIGRGALVDEAHLARRLADGGIAGAGLDVFEHEPLPDSSPLWGMPQVLVTPHISGLGPRHWERAVEMFGRNLRAFVAGEPLFNIVDRREGY